MKVMQIIPNLALAGAETMCKILSVELSDKGVKVIIVSLYDYRSTLTEQLESRGIDIRYLGKRKGFDFHILFKLYKLMRYEKPDVVHTHLYALRYAAPVAAVTGVHMRIHTMHSIASQETEKWAQKLYFLLFHFGGVIPVALNYEVQKTTGRVYHLSSTKNPVIYNGIDFEQCILKTTYVQKQKLRYIHIGRFAKVKNHAMLIDAFSIVHMQYPNTELILVGEGELRDMIQEKVKKMNLSDSVICYGTTDNVYSLLESADVFILTSLYEGMPMTIIEAMGTGLPIIASRVGGIPSMIEDGKEGLLTDVDVKSISKAMIQMMDQSFREKLGHAARVKAISNYSAEIMTRQYLNLYNYGRIIK